MVLQDTHPARPPRRRCRSCPPWKLLWAAGISKEDTGHAAQPAAADAPSRRRVSRAQKLPDCETCVPPPPDSRGLWTAPPAHSRATRLAGCPPSEPRGPRASPLLPAPSAAWLDFKMSSKLVCWSEPCLNHRLHREPPTSCVGLWGARESPALHALLVTS